MISVYKYIIYIHPKNSPVPTRQAWLKLSSGIHKNFHRFCGRKVRNQTTWKVPPRWCLAWYGRLRVVKVYLRMAWGSQLGMRMRTAGRMGDSLEYKGYKFWNQKPKTMFPNGMGQQFFSWIIVNGLPKKASRTIAQIPHIWATINTANMKNLKKQGFYGFLEGYLILCDFLIKRTGKDLIQLIFRLVSCIYAGFIKPQFRHAALNPPPSPPITTRHRHQIIHTEFATQHSLEPLRGRQGWRKTHRKLPSAPWGFNQLKGNKTGQQV